MLAAPYDAGITARNVRFINRAPLWGSHLLEASWRSCVEAGLTSQQAQPNVRKGFTLSGRALGDPAEGAARRLKDACLLVAALIATAAQT